MIAYIRNRCSFQFEEVCDRLCYSSETHDPFHSIFITYEKAACSGKEVIQNNTCRMILDVDDLSISMKFRVDKVVGQANSQHLLTGSGLRLSQIVLNIDGAVKSPISALRFTPRHCGVP